MTEITQKYSKRIGESYTLINHKSGLRAYIIPKDFSTTYCVIGVGCGGLDNGFIKDGVSHDFPYGMAHFLEHKLFANPDGEDTFEKFAETGAYCNAYTSFDKTAYLFSITGDIERSLDILLESFTSPYFTDENVKNEASIISEEIKMYMDDTYDALFYAMMGAMYSNPNTAQSVCGSVKSVNNITPEFIEELLEVVKHSKGKTSLHFSIYDPTEGVGVNMHTKKRRVTFTDELRKFFDKNEITYTLM
jgi:secreted Zn-dependent insulinase-like peptidase